MSEAAAEPQTLAEALAKMTPEQRAEAETRIAETLMRQPVELPTQWSVAAINTYSGPGLVGEVQTPAGSARVVMPRDSALQFASEIQRVAQTGPGLVVAQPSQVPGLTG